MPIYKLKDRKHSIVTSKPIEYVNNRWQADGKPIGDWTLSQIQFKDSDGYYKTPLPNGTLAVQDVDDNGNPIKHTLIGSNTKIPKKGTPGRQKIINKVNKETAEKYWKQAPIMRHATDSIANIYNINPALLKDRLNKEGFTNDAIQENNKNTKNKDKINNASNYSKLHQLNLLDFSNEHTQDLYGLDDGYYYIERGDVVPTIETNYKDHYFINKFGRRTHAVHGETVNDGINLTAATLKYFKDKASEDFPNSSRIFLDEAAGVYYNRGSQGGKHYMKNKYNK